MAYYKIKHRLPNRTRIYIPSIKGSLINSRKIQFHFSKIKGIISSQCNYKTGSLILYYDYNITGFEEILKELQLLFPERKKSLKKIKTKKRKASFIQRLLEVILLTAFMGYFLIKKIIFKQTIKQSMFSLPGIIAMLAGISVFEKATKDLIEKREITLYQFLAASTILGLALGEALTSLEIIWVMRCSMLVQDYITERSRKEIRKLLEISEKQVFLVVDGVEVEIDPERLKKGDVISAHSLEKIAVDGEIVFGKAFIDESYITGRAVPVLKKTGDKVFAGTIVKDGKIHIKAEKVGKDTYLSRMLQMIEDSLQVKAPIQTKADELASKLTKLGGTFTLITLLLTQSLYRALSVMLVMSCPCATILAASTAISAAISNAARKNILIKGGIYLEELGKCDVICFDKTGTITIDEPQVKTVIPCVKDISKEEVLSLAAMAEAHSQHPLAYAIQNSIDNKGFNAPAHTNYEIKKGEGVIARLNQSKIIVGNEKLMSRYKIDIKPWEKQTKMLLDQGETVIFVAKDKKLLGIMGISNTIRPGTKETLAALRRDGFSEINLITGDHELIGGKISNELNFDGYYASLLPDEKANIIKKIQDKKKKIIMVGDGINDALALAHADVGIAMGAGGSEVAIEAADIALASNEIDKIPYLRNLSRETIKIINQNYALAVGSNLGGVVLGFFGWLTPFMAGILHITHSLGVLANSSRLLTYKDKKKSS